MNTFDCDFFSFYMNEFRHQPLVLFDKVVYRYESNEYSEVIRSSYYTNVPEKE